MKSFFYEIEIQAIRRIFTKSKVSFVNIDLKVPRKCTKFNEIVVHGQNKRLKKEKLSKEEIRKRLIFWNKATKSRKNCEDFNVEQ